MSTQSERIRAVLARSEAPRLVREPDSQAQAIAVNTDNLEAFLRAEPAPAPPAPPERVIEVEEFLPLITTREETRAAVPEIQTPAPPFATVREKKTQGIPPVFLIIGGLSALAILAGVLVFAMKDRLFSPAPAAVAALPPITEGSNFPLQVRAEPQGNGLIDVRWNPQSASVAQARAGRLVITEQDQPARVVDLSTEQLKIGHVSYQSQTERLEFRLEVIDQGGSSTAESVLALSNKPALALAAQPLPMSTAPDPLQPVRQAPRPFTPPVPAATSIPEPRAMVMDAPAAVPMGSSAAPGSSDLRPSMPNLPAEPVKPAPPPVQPAPAPLRSGGRIQQPVLMKKISPIYPQLAKAGHIQGDVHFTATVGKDGKVQNLQVVSGPPALIQAAREAVKQWVYQPAQLNGETLEVTTEINVAFILGQ